MGKWQLFVKALNIKKLNFSNRKEMTENFIIIFSLLILVFFSSSNYYYGNYSLFYNNITLLFILIVGVVFFRKNINLLAHFILLLMAIGVLAMVYINKGQQYVPIWSFLFIYLSMVMYGYKKGLITSLLYCAILLSMFASWVGDTITHLEFLRFSAVILVTVIFAFLSELTITITLEHLRNSQKKLQEMTLTDALTTVYNRRQFDLVFTTTRNSVKRNNQQLAFVMIDIDFFKRYNDTYGHQQGDQALIDVAHFLKGKMKRANDAVFRLGGEEFAVLFSVKNHQQAFDIAKDVIQGVEALEITHEDSDVSRYLTVSAGLLVIENSNEKSKDEIYKACDDLLYKAKNSGRNQVATNIAL